MEKKRQDFSGNLNWSFGEFPLPKNIPPYLRNALFPSWYIWTNSPQNVILLWVSLEILTSSSTNPNLIDRWTLHLSACTIDYMWPRCVNARMQCTASSNSNINLSAYSWTLKLGCKFCQTCFTLWSAISRWCMEPLILFDACHFS